MVKIKKISVMPLAQILCVFHAVIGFFLGVIATVLSITNQADDGFWSLGAWSLLVFPVINAGVGFFTGTFLAWGYNLSSRWFGGIEFDIEDK